jgi:hypothetical protein
MGRPLRAPGAQQANAEEMLAELVRLVESSGLAPERSVSSAETVSEPKWTDTEPMQPLEMTSLHPSVDAPPSKPGKTRAVDVEPPRASEAANSYSNDPILARRQRTGGWTFEVSALVLAAAAVIGSIFWLKRVEPGLPKAAPFISAAQVPPTVQPRSNLTVATSSDAGVTPTDIMQPGQIVSSEAQPIDLNARVSVKNPPPSANLGPTGIGLVKPTAVESAGEPLAVPVNTPAAAAAIAASQPMASQSLDSKPVPAVPLSPDPAQIAMPTPSATNSGVAAHASDAPLPPVRPAPKAAIEAAGVAERSRPKLDMPTKLSSKSAAHVVLAKTDATGRLAPTETPSDPLRRGASVNPVNGAKTLNAAQAPAVVQAAPSEQSAPAQRPNPNPVVHAFSYMVGALTGLIPFATH